MSSRLEVAADPWRILFEAPDGVKFNVVLTGSCLLTVEGVPEPVRVEPGDCFLLTRSTAFVLASDLTAPAVLASSVFSHQVAGVARHGTADVDASFVAVGGGFSFSAPAARLLDALPPVLHVPAGAPEAASIAEVLATVAREVREDLPGSTAVVEHLAVVMLVRMLRWHLAQGPGTPPGWLRGLADPVVGRALTALHGDPARRWTVAELARTCAVSRSTLSERFRTVVGSGPIEYLVGWRMEIATQDLLRGDESVAAIGRRLGYASESAFSTAYKRVRGGAPSHVRRGAIG